MGLFTYTVAGGAFLLIGAWESLASASSALQENPSLSPPSPPANTDSATRSAKTTSFSSSITFLSIFVLSLLAILNSLISLFDAATAKDNTGLVLQLEVITIALLFLLHALLGFLSRVKDTFHVPASILNLISLFGFGEEFLLFYMQKKDPSGIENRYYDLFLVPVAICLFSTMLELKNPKSSYARLGRGVGLVLQGMWILQMGFSFFSSLVLAEGCTLNDKSRGNYTIKCKGHMEYHRGRAIATLQFNCHLALLVTLIVVVYAVFCKKYGISREFLRYKPLGDGGEMHQLDGNGQFSLETDDEDDHGIKEVGNVEMQKAIVAVPDSGLNGYGNHS